MAWSQNRERTSVPWRSRPFQIVLVSTIVLPLGVPLLSPFLPLVRDAFAITDVRTSYLISAYFLPGIVLSPIIGRVSDRVGRQPVLGVSLLTFGIVGAGIAVLADFTLVLAARFVQGIAAAGIFITTVTIIADSFTGLQRNAVFGINVAVLSVGRTLSPLLGGSLARYGWRVPFVCYLVAVPIAVFVFQHFDESVRMHRLHEPVTGRETISELVANGTPLLYGATIFAELVVFGAIMTALPFLLVADYGVSTVLVGVIIAMTTVASALVAAANGWFARRFSNRHLVVFGFLLFGTSLVGIGLASALSTVAVLVPLFGAGIGLLLPSVDAAISQAVAEESRGGALGLRNSATSLGRATGPLLFTGLALLIGYRELVVIAGVGTLIAGFGGLVLLRWPRRGYAR